VEVTQPAANDVSYSGRSGGIVPPVVGEDLERRRTEMLFGIELSKPYPAIAEENRLFLHCFMLEAILDISVKDILYREVLVSTTPFYKNGEWNVLGECQEAGLRFSLARRRDKPPILRSTLGAACSWPTRPGQPWHGRGGRSGMNVPLFNANLCTIIFCIFRLNGFPMLYT